MASAAFSFLHNLWPFSIFKYDDLRGSSLLVKKLNIPEQTKQFVFAAREPGSNSVVYILAVQNLSEQSALDVDTLIQEVKPKAVLAQIAPGTIAEIHNEEKYLSENQANAVPVSPFEVLKKCFMEKINKDEYEKIASCQVLQEIFGVGLHSNFLAAKRAANQVGSCLLLLESPFDNSSVASESGDAEKLVEPRGLQFLTSNSILGTVSSIASSNPGTLPPVYSVQAKVSGSAIPLLDVIVSVSSSTVPVPDSQQEQFDPVAGYEPPTFAKSIYPLLADLHDVFLGIPLIGKALSSCQKMLSHIHEGLTVSSETLSDVYFFRIAIESLRICLNNAARSSVNGKGSTTAPELSFSELSLDEKSHVLFVEALRSHVREFGSVVAIVDVACLGNLRKYWNTRAPPENASLALKCVKHFDNADDFETSSPLVDHGEKKGQLGDKPMVAVGTGAAAIWGASSLSRAVYASSFLKVAAVKLPLALEYTLLHLKRSATVGLSKALLQLKILGPGIASVGSKASASASASSIKAKASAETIRAVTHSVITSGKKTSLMAMRTAFYEIMQKRRLRPSRFTPWVTFGCSMAAGATLLVHGDGIECAAELLPALPTITSLGRGLESLHHTSLAAWPMNSTRIKEALRAMMSIKN